MTAAAASPARAIQLLRMALAHAVLAGGAVAMLLPFVWMALTSIRPPDEVLSNSLNPIPGKLHAIENYSAALNTAPLGQFMINGVIVCLGILVVQLIVAIPAAYALAKVRFPGRELFFALVVAGLCIPIQAPALPLYLALAEFKLLDSYFALMAPFFLSVFAIFLFRQTFKTFPDEIIQAARIDGLGETEILWRIVAPSALPAVAAFSIFSIVAHWNDLYWPMIVIQRLEYATPPLGMLFFVGSESGTNYGSLMAGAVVITAPLLILFLVARRRFVRGITMTGIK
jgi:multiple sugar transport system permease protein